MVSAFQKYLRSEYSHSVHGGVSSLLAVVNSPAHQHTPQECTGVPGPSLGTIPHTTSPSSTVHCRPPWQCSATELWQALTLYQAFLRRGLPGSHAFGPRALPGLPSPRPTWEGGGGAAPATAAVLGGAMREGGKRGLTHRRKAGPTATCEGRAGAGQNVGGAVADRRGCARGSVLNGQKEPGLGPLAACRVRSTICGGTETRGQCCSSACHTPMSGCQRRRLGRWGFQLGGRGINRPPKTGGFRGGGGVRKRAPLTGPLFSYPELWRRRLF